MPRLYGWLAMPFLVSAAVAAQMEVRTDIEFATVADTRLLMDAYLPRGSGPFPAIIWVHGGGFVSGDKKQYPKVIIDPLLDSGFAVFSVNYRLAPKHPFPAATDDLESAIHYIKSHAESFKVDPDRLILMGESAGGHLVSFVGAKHKPENRVAGVVSFYGEHDLVARTTEDPCIMDGKAVPKPPGGCLSPGLAAFLGISEVTIENEKLVREASAVTYVKKDMPAYLLIHGTREFHVPFEQAVIMHEAMEKVGADCTLIPVIGGSHGLGGWEKSPTMQEYKPRMMEWIRKQTHTQAQPLR